MEQNEPLDNAYVQLRHKLLAVARSMDLSADDAADALHDSYLRLHGKRLPSRQAAEGSLTVTLRNLAIDFRRRFSRRASTGLRDDHLTTTGENGDLTAREIIGEMRRLLSPLQFRILHMLAVEGFDYPEIAGRLGMNEGAVRTNVSRARKILREKLDYDR